jgi:hypothetical protein
VTPVQNVDLPASGTVVQQVSAPIGFAYAVEGAGCVLERRPPCAFPQVTAVRRPFRFNV